MSILVTLSVEHNHNQIFLSYIYQIKLGFLVDIHDPEIRTNGSDEKQKDLKLRYLCGCSLNLMTACLVCNSLRNPWPKSSEMRLLYVWFTKISEDLAIKILNSDDFWVRPLPIGSEESSQVRIYTSIPNPTLLCFSRHPNNENHHQNISVLSFIFGIFAYKSPLVEPFLQIGFTQKKICLNRLHVGICCNMVATTLL